MEIQLTTLPEIQPQLLRIPHYLYPPGGPVLQVAIKIHQCWTTPGSSNTIHSILLFYYYFNQRIHYFLKKYFYLIAFHSSRSGMLKANKNGVIVIRQTPNTNLSAKKAKPPPSAESKRSVHLSRNSSRRNSRNEDPSKFNNMPNNERKKSSTFRSSKSPSKSNQMDKLSKAKSFHELNNDLTPPRSPILPTRYIH